MTSDEEQGGGVADSFNSMLSNGAIRSCRHYRALAALASHPSSLAK
jgi:hypothetical protein